jgi:hypothetical protein
VVSWLRSAHRSLRLGTHARQLFAAAHALASAVGGHAYPCAPIQCPYFVYPSSRTLTCSSRTHAVRVSVRRPVRRAAAAADGRAPHEPARARVCRGAAERCARAQEMALGSRRPPCATSAPGRGLTSATSAPGRGSPLSHLHRDWGSPVPHSHRCWVHRSIVDSCACCEVSQGVRISLDHAHARAQARECVHPSGNSLVLSHRTSERGREKRSMRE